MIKANLFAALLITVSAFAADPWHGVDTILGQTGRAAVHNHVNVEK